MNAPLDYRMPAAGSYQELIAQRARELWQIRGRPEGQDNAIWLDAEQDLVRRRLIPRSAVSTEPQHAAGHVDAAKVADRLNDFARPSGGVTSLNLTHS